MNSKEYFNGDELAASLDGADRVFVYRPEGMDANFDNSLAVLGERLCICDDFDALVAAMEKELQAGDHVVFMSNGGFGASRQKLTMALQRRRATNA